MQYVEHPLIKPNTLEARQYQTSILATAKKKNLLCVLPTGLGKTSIAALLAVERLSRYPKSKVLILAPTRPLVAQHYTTFSKWLNFAKTQLQVITGLVKPTKRKELYKTKRLFFATPQTIEKDLQAKRLSLRPFSLLVLDEIHHAVGRYAYPYVSQVYFKEAEWPRVLGLTASPGSSSQKIKQVCENCGIKAVEIRGEADLDVTPYVYEKKVEWINVQLPESFKKVQKLLVTAYSKRIERLRCAGFLSRKIRSKKQLLELQAKMANAIRAGYKKAFFGISQVSQAIKIEHATNLLETQGVGILEHYLAKLVKGKIANDMDILKAAELTHELTKEGCRHPKISTLCSITHRYISSRPDSKIIIFANFRDTVREIVEVLQNIDGVKPIDFVGQRKGITQKEQIKRINEFKAGKYNVLVGTCISEEGLDIPAMDLAIFYEPVPSEIRSIQRRGRVGRFKAGKIIILIAKGTRDEAYYWVAKQKEKRMRKTLYEMQAGLKNF